MPLSEANLICLNNIGLTRGEAWADFDETFQTALRFLEPPCLLWTSGNPDDRKLLLRLAFEDKLPYHRNGGF